MQVQHGLLSYLHNKITLYEDIQPNIPLSPQIVYRWEQKYRIWNYNNF